MAIAPPSVRLCPARTSARPYLSVVAPAYNEEQGIESFVTTVDSKLAQLLLPSARSWEIVLVDDGSRDGTVAAIDALSARVCRCGWCSYRATSAISWRSPRHRRGGGRCDHHHGCRSAAPAGLLGAMLAAMDDGADVVLMRKTLKPPARELQDGAGPRLLCPDGASRTCTPSPMSATFGCSRVRSPMSCEAVARRIASAGLVAWVGFRQVTLDYEVAPRFAGSSKYDLRRLWRLASSGLFSHSSVPLKWPLYLGMPLFGGAALYILWGVLQRLLQPELTPRGWLSALPS